MKKVSNKFFPKLSTEEAGFTAGAFILVVGIIITLVVLFVKIFNPAQEVQKIRDSQRKEHLATIQKALSLYYQSFGIYPENTEEFFIQVTEEGTVRRKPWGESFSPFLPVLPRDPLYPTRTYIYSVSDNGKSYVLYASLEYAKDPSLCNKGLACPNVPKTASCGGVCNYGVSSGNTSP